MANNAAAEKRIRQAERRTERNKAVKSRFRTALRRFNSALAGGDQEQVLAAFARASSLLDKAAKGGVMHVNAASRHKSRLAREWAKAQAGA